MNLTAEFGELAGDEVGCSVLLEAKFGVGVQVSPPLGHLVVKQIDEMWNLHDEHLQHGMLRTGTPMFVSKANAACVA